MAAIEECCCASKQLHGDCRKDLMPACEQDCCKEVRDYRYYSLMPKGDVR